MQKHIKDYHHYKDIGKKNTVCYRRDLESRNKMDKVYFQTKAVQKQVSWKAKEGQERTKT